MDPVRERLDDRLARPRAGGPGGLACVACAHRCTLAPGEAGTCRVRSNRDGHLAVPWGHVAAVTLDPVEKKPFYHVRPGSRVLTFGMPGCSFHCAFCQNWFVSQAGRDPAVDPEVESIEAGGLVERALGAGAAGVVSSFNEPLITAEWAREIFAAARSRGLFTGIVSNGFGTPEVLDFLAPVLTVAKVDLKAFGEPAYRSMGGGLGPVLDSIDRLLAAGIWVEVVTVLIPGLNDSEGEVAAMAAWLAGRSRDLPWHLHGFHPDYRMLDRPATPARTLERAGELGREAGLRYVYRSLAPGLPAGAEATACPGCGLAVVERRALRCDVDRLGPEGRCPACGERVPGRWR